MPKPGCHCSPTDLRDGRIRTLLLMGTNIALVVRRRISGGRGTARRASLVVSYDLFMNETARRFADVVLPSTGVARRSWDAR